MGQSRPIICNECGKHWTHRDGSGFISAIYYCDLCANQKNKGNKAEILEPVISKQCKCNVNFKLDETILCPECQSSDLEVV